MAANSPTPVDFKALFEKSPGLCLILDPDLRVVAVSDAYCRTVRSTREDLIGLRIVDMVSDRDRDAGEDGYERLNQSLERVLRFKRPDTMAIQRYVMRRSKRGGFVEKYWSPRNAPILDDKGDVRWIIHCVYDVTSAIPDPGADESRRRLAQNQARLILELQRANDELAQIDSLRSGLLQMSRLNTMAMMASALAHDLSQPLTAARNYLGALKRAGHFADPKAEEVFGKLSLQIDRTSDIVRTLRSYMSAATTAHRPEEVAAVVADAARLAETAVRLAGAKLVVSVAPELPAVRMDRIQIQQVLVNLVTNAAEAVAGRERREIAVSVQRDAGALRFDIADTGPGLPDDIAKHLLESFASTKLMAMGLGLPISRQIVGEHNGTMWITPNAPTGTVVSFALAVGAPAAAEERFGDAAS